MVDAAPRSTAQAMPFSPLLVEAGLRGAMGLALTAATLAAGAHFRLGAPPVAEGPRVEQIAVAAPPLTPASIDTLPAAAAMTAPSAPVMGAIPTVAVAANVAATSGASEAPAAAPDMTLAPLTLTLPARLRDDYGGDASPSAQPPSAPRTQHVGAFGRGALARGAVARWAAPADGLDVALFGASGRDVVSWSLNGDSPNRGALAYRRDTVKVGEVAVGVALTERRYSLAAAYVQREPPQSLGGGRGREEDYAGLILTRRR